jgi:ATP-dependent RNA helicase DDX52/ROK1
MTSDAFHLLSRGGVSFDKSKSIYEARLFNVGFFFLSMHCHCTFTYMCQKRNLTDGKNTAFLNLRSGELPHELNFFKDTQTNLGKRKASDTSDHQEGKKKKTGSGDSLKFEDEDEEPQLTSALTTHRVTVRGTNIPQHLDSFEALKETYELPSQLVSNLCSNGYKKPTSIQAYCAPILLSVSLMEHSGNTAHNLKGRDLVAISPTGTGKTLSYLLPIFSKLRVPSSSSNAKFGLGTRALVVVPTRELAHQIHNECLKLAQGRKWKLVLLSKASVNSFSDKTVRNKIGAY